MTQVSPEVLALADWIANEVVPDGSYTTRALAAAFREVAHNAAIAAIAAIQAVNERAGWQSIETAPKDGSEILGWREDAGVIPVRWTRPIDFMTGSELDKLDEWSAVTFDWFYADFVEGGRLEGDECPTHWMPLPPPPSDAIERGDHRETGDGN